MVVESLVAATKDVGDSWLDLLSIVVRSIDTKPRSRKARHSGDGDSPITITRPSTSNGGATISSHTPIAVDPPQIVVTGNV